MRVYDSNGKPTNQFTSKLEIRDNKPGVAKAMMKDLQSRLPEGHEYTEDVSVSTDGLKFISSQLNHGYAVAMNQDGSVRTQSVAISGESKVNDLPIHVDQNGKFENVSVTTKKQFDAARPIIAKIVSSFNAGLTEQNVRWENGTIFVDVPVLKKTFVEWCAGRTCAGS